MTDRNNTIPPAMEIPYFDHGSNLSETIKHSSERRKMSKFKFVCRKIREYIFIGDDVSLAGEVTVVAHINPYAHFKNVFESMVTPVVIEKGAWVGVKCTLVPGARIGA